MASSSGNSWGSSAMNEDERKRKRMQSNRESARRSRIRKQQRLDELVAVAEKLRRENSRVAEGVSVVAGHVAAMETENSVLRAQMSELDHRLRSLNEIAGGFVDDVCGGGGEDRRSSFVPESLLARYSHVPIIRPNNIASADLMFY